MLCAADAGTAAPSMHAATNAENLFAVFLITSFFIVAADRQNELASGDARIAVIAQSITHTTAEVGSDLQRARYALVAYLRRVSGALNVFQR